MMHANIFGKRRNVLTRSTDSPKERAVQHQETKHLAIEKREIESIEESSTVALLNMIGLLKQREHGIRSDNRESDAV